MRSFLIISLLLVSTSALAASQRTNGFVRIGPDKELYVDYTPAEPGKPTLVLLNGLTYKAESWDKFSAEFNGSGVGILRYDMTGMGRTLLRDSLPVTYRIQWQKQVEELYLLVHRLRIPKAYYLGLSYGGGIVIPFAAKYPRLVDSVILLAPFTQPLEGQDSLIRYQMAAARALNPWLTSSDDDLYDFFLRQLIYSTYPLAEPVVLENPYKLEAVFRMVQGIRKMLALDHVGSLSVKSLHLLVGREDQYIPQTVFDRFWENVPRTKRASRIIIAGSGHKLPEVIPHFTAEWVKEIIRKNPLLYRGLTFTGNAFTGAVELDEQKAPTARKGQ